MIQNRRSNKYLFLQLKKFIRKNTWALNIIVILFGIMLLIVGQAIDSPFLSPGNENTPSHGQQAETSDSADFEWIGLIENIGCGLISSGLLAFIIYPNIETEDRLYFHSLHDEQGLCDTYLSGNILTETDGTWQWPHKYFDLITDHSDDLKELRQYYNNIPKNLKIRILTSQPKHSNICSQINSLKEWAKENGCQVTLKYYGGSRLPYYCRQDNYVTLGYNIDPMEDGTRIFYRYDIHGDVGEKAEKAFNQIWNGHLKTALISTSTFGREKTTQESCITAVLKYFCDTLKHDVGLKNNVEAVVVVWTDKEDKRITLYSYNKPQGASFHNIKDYSKGVVGMLQKCVKEKNLEAESQRTDCILLYDHDKAPTKCEYIFDWRAGTIRSELVAEQTWSQKETKAMLAISLFRQNHDKAEMFGALTFDFAESLSKKKEASKRKLFFLATQCRNMLLPLLATRIEEDYEPLLLELEQAEKNSENKEGA